VELVPLPFVKKDEFLRGPLEFVPFPDALETESFRRRVESKDRVNQYAKPSGWLTAPTRTE
jgi:hypothetical protein